ncbi:hypothetical protein BC827DRAFT_1340904 [Russula dissimulans]|nr:hypothetical protein BC827DRAFT_1340904 [Russula dissimulans]
MIIILAIFAATRASPLGPPSPLVSRDRLQAPSCSDPDGCRSLWDIIRSCIFTILLCTWASVHPNIPSPDERWPRIAVRRVGLMLATLFVPEVVIGWALRQRMAAGRLANEHKDKGWTITHGFFAIMGGFMEYDGNRPVRVLFPEQLQSYSLTGNGDFPKISKAEIKDKSKRDAISKTVVILQTGWFVIQCIARVAHGLPITELELVTVALATLNFVIYLLWWHKPLNVQRGVRVYKQRITEQPIDDGDVEDDMGYWDALRDAFSITVQRPPIRTRQESRSSSVPLASRGQRITEEPIDDGDVEADVGFWDALRENLSELPAAIADGPLTRELPRFSWLYRVIFWPFITPSQILGTAITGREYEDLKRVPTFYPDEWPTERTRVVGFALVAAVASVFGGIHCLGWLFTFPSSNERIRWRVASIFVVVIPITISLCLVLRPILKRKNPRILYLLHSIVGTQVGVYIYYRSTLLILAFLTLRSLPPAAYRVVHWTSSIPHV